MTPTRCLPLLPLILVAACSVDPETTLETVHLTEEAMVEAIAAHDIEGVMRGYADDAVVHTSGAAPQVGSDAIRASFEKVLADPGLAMEFTPGQAWTAKSGELAVTTGTLRYTSTTEGAEPQALTMNSQTVWRKGSDTESRVGGLGWQIVSVYNIPQGPAAGS
jgi:ketosteroid isomerase-like protein